MGGHVEACEDCGHWRVAYNSCRNRHCPKCQGAAARTWLAEREADLLPVGYFHVVFTLPAEISAIAQKKVITFEVDYYQTRVRAVVQKLILTAFVYVFPEGSIEPPVPPPGGNNSFQFNRPSNSMYVGAIAGT